ncbi:ABC transporter substrate-binding protein [Streptomyces sp. NPDC059096]|uniref:ABC transporter substrate-binding protein n=1 Tax=Streptomyces sp. NPDC059096 TaxID=3346727 RepID=UPI00369A87FB
MHAHAHQGFPDDEGADVFVRELRTAVAPDGRDALTARPPMVVLQVPGDGAVQDSNVSRVLKSLTQPLEGDGKLVPYAILSAANDSLLLSASAGKEMLYRIPRHMTPERLPRYTVLRDVIAYIREHAGPWPDHAATALRDDAYQQRVRRSRFLLSLWSLSGGDTPPASGWRSWFVGKAVMGVIRTFPRWWWTRRVTARLIRGRGPFLIGRRARWLGAELNAARSREDFFQVMDAVADRQAPRLADPAHPRFEESLLALEQILLRALLEDLRTPRAGGVLPQRRRRTARPVLLVPLPRAGETGRRAAERFLRAYQEVSVQTRPPGPLTIVVGRPDAALLAELSPQECSLQRMASLLHQGGTRPLLVDLREEPFGRDGQSVRKAAPRTFRLDWRVPAVAAGTTTVLVAALLGLYVADIVGDSPESQKCLGGTEAVKTRNPPDVDPKKLYNATLEAIKQQNESAREYVKQGKQVRTIVYFGSDGPTGTVKDAVFDGNIPELRGIALWQKRLNDKARANDSLVRLIVDVRTTGPGFRNAEEKAKKLVEEIESAENGSVPPDDYKQVVGVLGFAQSNKETQEALGVLGKAGVPVVGTTATADDMKGSTYQPFTPLNSTEARIAAAFVSGSNIVPTGGGNTCTPADTAVVIQNSADLYSKSLADQFTDKLPGDEFQIDISPTNEISDPEDPGRMANPQNVAETVCDWLGKNKKAVVYWTARARDFTAFVDALGSQESCTEGGLTVMGGNELTNVALTGKYSEQPWLRLYHTAHRLPADDGRASEGTKNFVADYDEFVPGAPENDPWRDDGHSAVAYDAFQLLSRAVDDAKPGNMKRGSVLTALEKGISFEGGATGFIRERLLPNKPPKDKTLVILKQTLERPVAVAACGTFSPKEKVERQGPPCTSAPSTKPTDSPAT